MRIRSLIKDVNQYNLNKLSPSISRKCINGEALSEWMCPFLISKVIWFIKLPIFLHKLYKFQLFKRSTNHIITSFNLIRTSRIQWSDSKECLINRVVDYYVILALDEEIGHFKTKGWLYPRFPCWIQQSFVAIQQKSLVVVVATSIASQKSKLLLSTLLTPKEPFK